MCYIFSWSFWYIYLKIEAYRALSDSHGAPLVDNFRPTQELNGRAIKRGKNVDWFWKCETTLMKWRMEANILFLIKMNNVVYVLDDKIILLGLWFCFDFSTFRMYFDYKRYEYFGFEKIGMRNLLSDKIDIENLFSRRTNYEINIVFCF